MRFGFFLLSRLLAGRSRWALLLALAGGAARAAEEPWVKVATEHFTILTPAGEAAAREWAIELEQFRRGLQNIVPVAVTRLRPVTVVLFRNERAMEPYVPRERGQPARIGGLFVRANDLNTIMLSLSRGARSTRRLIFHEAVHWHLSALEGVMPLWLAEGLAELYATFELPDAKTYAFGAPMPEYVSQMQAGNFLPLSQLLSIDRSSLLYNEGTRASIFYAQSWAFAHFLFFGEDSPGRAAVLRYLELLPAARSPAEAFEAAFGGDYAALEARLRRHVHGGIYHRRSYARSTDDIQRLLKVSWATAADVELAKGSLLFGARSGTEAEPALRRAAQLAPDDPRAWELLGHIALERRDLPAAAAALAKAAAAGSASYLVYHNLAVSRMPEPLIRGFRHSGLEPAEMDSAAANYRKAIRLATWHVPSYEGLAGLVYGMATFVPEDLDVLARGLLESPGNAMIEAGLAAGEIRLGRSAEGRAKLEQLGARAGGDSDPGVKFARQVLAAERWKADLAEIERLAPENRFAEIVALADRALARELPAEQQRVLADVRRRMADLQTVAEAIALANDGGLDAAKQKLEALLAAAPHPAARGEAERVLREFSRHELHAKTPQ